MAIYCPQGSGTLRQQLLSMHDIAWFCMVLHGIAWYFIVLHGIAWYCMVLPLHSPPTYTGGSHTNENQQIPVKPSFTFEESFKIICEESFIYPFGYSHSYLSARYTKLPPMQVCCMFARNSSEKLAMEGHLNSHQLKCFLHPGGQRASPIDMQIKPRK